MYIKAVAYITSRKIVWVVCIYLNVVNYKRVFSIIYFTTNYVFNIYYNFLLDIFHVGYIHWSLLVLDGLDFHV